MLMVPSLTDWLLRVRHLTSLGSGHAVLRIEQEACLEQQLTQQKRILFPCSFSSGRAVVADMPQSSWVSRGKTAISPTFPGAVCFTLWAPCLGLGGVGRLHKGPRSLALHLGVTADSTPGSGG